MAEVSGCRNSRAEKGTSPRITVARPLRAFTGFLSDHRVYMRTFALQPAPCQRV